MQYFRPGSQLRQIITMLSIVGEYPIRSLCLLGNERAYKALVHAPRVLLGAEVLICDGM